MTTAHLDVNNTVGEWVVDAPSRSRVFERFGIDYCCGGKRPLAEACLEKDLDEREVIAALHEETVARGDERDWAAASLTELCDHIEATHHVYLTEELPRLRDMIGRVVQAHGPRHPEVHELQRVFAAFQAEIDEHKMKEERVLFPMIRQIEQADSMPQFHCGSLTNPVRVMEHEHDSAGDALAKMRELTGGYTTPADACNTWRAMVDGLRQLEADMHQHIHKENNILFPRAIERERALPAL